MKESPLASRGQWRELLVPFDDAVARLPDALKREGFGVLTEIDVQATLKAKLGVDSRRYRIFGACNPTFAHAALEKNVQVGLLLPCNVVLYERDDGRTVCGVIDPMETLGASDPAFREIAGEVGGRLARVLETMSAS